MNRPIKHWILPVATWLLLGQTPLPAAGPQQVAQGVLDRLYATNGNYRFKKPKLVLSGANDRVAAFNPWKNTITLDQKTYDICRSFGRDSLSALAYVLGHELVHAYQSEIKSGRVQTNFLAYNRQYSADIRLEQVADIQGLFNGYLAGYRVLEVMPALIEQVYRDYQLLGKTLSGYPSLDERKASTATVLEIAGQLRDVFEASNYLLAIGQHALAVGGYEYILQYYQGIEIYNNLGVACALSAQEFWNPATDNYAYPLETDWNSKLERAASRGQEQLDPGMEPFRAAYLDKAESHFRSAIRLQSNYRAAHTNLVCVLNLKAQAAAALQHAERFLLRDINRRRKRPQQELELAEIALGISYALLGGPRRPQAEAIFQRLANASHPAAALYASENLQYLRGEHRQPAPSSMTLPASLRQTLRSAQLGRTSQFERIRLSEKSGLHFARQHNGSGATFVFSNERGNLVSLIRLPVDAFAGARISAAGVDLARSGYKNLVAATEGFFIHNTAEKSVLRVDADGRVLDAVKYLIH